MIYINCKYKKAKRATGVQRVAAAYHEYLHTHYKRVSDLDYRAAGKWCNIEEQALGWRRRFESSDLVLHPANTAPLTKLAACELLLLHDMIFLDYPESYHSAFTRWYRTLIPRIAKTKDLILTVSAFSKQRIRERLGIGESIIVVVPNGVDERFFADKGDDFISGNRERPFLAVGSLSARKRMQDIILAHKQLPEHLRRDHPLWIIGGNTGIFQDTGLNTGTDIHIRLTGYVDDGQLIQTYLQGLTLVTASEYEGFGLPIIEAFASGTHVIASDIPPHREILGKRYDSFFPAGDVGSLTSRMVNTIHRQETLYSRAKVKERKALAGQFAWDVRLQTLGSVVETLHSQCRA